MLRPLSNAYARYALAFRQNESGAVAIMFGIALIGIIGLAGFAIDYARVTNARLALQQAVDSAVLAAAKVDSQDPAELKAAAERYFAASRRPDDATVWVLDPPSFDSDKKSLSLTARGEIKTSLLSVIGHDKMEFSVTTTGVRDASSAYVEVALVLDNTWSMTEPATGGSETKISALKKAAGKLVNSMVKDSKSNAKISIVPFADLVNVGKENRSQPWITVPADYRSGYDKQCYTVTTTTSCTPGTPMGCTEIRDGITKIVDCPYTCKSVPLDPSQYYQYCYGPYWTDYTWWGCVKPRPNRLHITDGNTSVKYEGVNISTAQICPNPIIPLTNDKGKLNSSVNNMMLQSAYWYKPDTYIPIGLLWGINVLTPDAPYTEGNPFDPNKKQPRKAIVLMTDGFNTMKYNDPSGYLSAAYSPAQLESNRMSADEDTMKLCQLAKDKGIDVYTIAFAVPDTSAKTMLQNCASKPEMFYDAMDTAAFYTAFDKISMALGNLRLSH